MCRLVSVRAKSQVAGEHAKICHADNHPLATCGPKLPIVLVRPKGAMVTLRELRPTERKELARSLAKEIWIGVEHYGEMPNAGLEEGVYKLVAKSDLLHESNFYGEGFNEAQNAKIKEFHDHREKGCDLADQYEKDIANGVGKIAPGFAMPQELLRRAWTTNIIVKELCKEDSPFATLRTADVVEDVDRTDESNDENNDESEESAEESVEESAEESEDEEEEYVESEGGSSSSEDEEGGEGDDPSPKRKKLVRECERKTVEEEDRRGLLDSDSD